MVRLLYTLTNTIFNLPRHFGYALLLLLALALVLLLRIRERATAAWRAARYLGLVALAFLALALLVNEYTQVLMVARMRYLMALWPPLVLLTAFGAEQLGKRRRRLADWTLAALVASGIVMSAYYMNVDAFWPSNIHLADQALRLQARADDFLLLEDALLPPSPKDRIREYYLAVLAYPRALVTLDDGEHGQYVERAQPHARVWLLVSRRGSALEGALDERMVLCRRPVSGEGRDMTLTLYARTAADCA